MSEKNRDDKNRWRNVTIAFRMSPEENEELNNRVKLSGFRTKQDYIIQSVLHQKVVATGNPLMLVQFRQKNLVEVFSGSGNDNDVDVDFLCITDTTDFAGFDGF